MLHVSININHHQAFVHILKNKVKMLVFVGSLKYYKVYITIKLYHWYVMQLLSCTNHRSIV